MMKRLFLHLVLVSLLMLPASLAAAQTNDSLIQSFTGPSSAPGGALPDFSTPSAMPVPEASVPLAPLPTPPLLIPLAVETPPAPIVVELFTSEGCSSCPPANAYLRELSKRKNLLPLSFHVDYWDYIGWKDRFANPAFTERQRAYAAAQGKTVMYTPQMVVAGAIETVGSDHQAVEKALKAANRRNTMYALTLAKDASGGIHLGLPQAALSVPASLWLVTYSYEGATDISGGENRGQHMITTNVVHTLRKVGTWDGRPDDRLIKLDASEIAAKPDACAIIANEAEFGPVVAATGWDFKDLW
jgi:hypothetical protein